MASEVAQPELIDTSLSNDVPMTNGDHEPVISNDEAHNAAAFEENAALLKTDTSLDITNIPAADSNPGGPTPVEDVAPGITNVADFMPKNAPASHPTPPPDEPLAASEANLDTEMTSADEVPATADEVPIAKAEAEGDAPAALPAEQSLVRPREDDDEDEERSIKRSKIEDDPSREATLADLPPTAAADEAQPETQHEAQPETRPEAPVEFVTAAADNDVVIALQPSDAPVLPPINGDSAAESESDVKPSVETVEAQDPSNTVPLPAAPAAGAAGASGASYSKEPMTRPQHKFLIEKMKNLKKTKNSTAFLHPVDPLALSIPTYLDIVKTPMDLGTMESKLKTEQYESVQAFADDFALIIGNTLKFNGEAHAVTQAGRSMEAYFRKMMETVPSANQPAPKPPQKKVSPAFQKPPAPGRRESRHAAAPLPSTVPAPSNATAGLHAAESFALQADGTPQIRRDSTINRPPRAIKPPPARELAYAKPKRKEHQMELKFCEHVLNLLKSPKYGHLSTIFLMPVDPVALNIPHYRQVIKHPMDLSTMTQKLKQGQYGKAAEFKKDFELMIQNCLTFNPPGNTARDLGISFKREFELLWGDKEKWERGIKASNRRATSASADEESGDEDEDEEDEAPDNATDTIRALQKQLADMQNALAGLHKPAKSKKAKPAAKTHSKKASHAPAPKSKAAAKPKAPKKPKQVTYEEKQEISEAVGKMNDLQVQELTRIITDNCKKYADQEEMELEIDDLPNDVQLLLLTYVRDLFGGPKKGRQPSPEDDNAAMDDDDFEPSERGRRAGNGAGGRRKKHKPMGKKEQQETIAGIQKQLAAFNGGSGMSGSGSPTNSFGAGDQGAETSGDDESEESEEE